MSARPAVLRASELPGVDRGGGARTVPLVTRALGATSMLNGITRFEPSAGIALHTHNCEESVLVLDGECIALVDGVEHRLTAGDLSFIPADIPHRFVNASATEPARIFWTYASAQATRTLVESGETRAISAEHGAPSGAAR